MFLPDCVPTAGTRLALFFVSLSLPHHGTSGRWGAVECRAERLLSWWWEGRARLKRVEEMAG